MEQLTFKVEGENIDFFNISYSQIFNENWYPNYFINQGFSVFLSKKKPISLSLNKIIEFLINNFNDSQILVKTYDFTKDNPTKKLIIPIDVFKEKYIFKVEELMLSSSEITSEMGMILFGDSCQWAYYFGEELYDDFNLEEFDLFIIKKEMKQNLIQFIKQTYPNINIKTKTKGNIFKEADFFKNELFEIKI